VSDPVPGSATAAFVRLDAAAAALVGAAEASQLVLRVVGGVGIWQRLRNSSREAFVERRTAPRDIDLLASSKSGPDVRRLLEGSGLSADERLIAWRGDRRHRYFLHEGELEIEVDVFLGSPPLCHKIEFESRLHLPGPAATATDLFLQKLQIAQCTEKDLFDLVFLLVDHPVTETEASDGIDQRRVLGLLSRDWGFYYTATQNIALALASAEQLPDIASRELVLNRLSELSDAIEQVPKSRTWRLRSRVGTRAPWFEEVEEIER